MSRDKKISRDFYDRETSEADDTNHEAEAKWSMLYASEGLTFGHRPNALGLRSEWKFTQSWMRVKETAMILENIVLSMSIFVVSACSW